jgi:hypothetical protein
MFATGNWRYNLDTDCLKFLPIQYRYRVQYGSGAKISVFIVVSYGSGTNPMLGCLKV